MKALFLEEAKANKGFRSARASGRASIRRTASRRPTRAGVSTRRRRRMPEFTAPGLGRESNHVTIDAELGENASGVLYALGGASGGLTLYMDKGELVYEYNMMIIERYTARSKDKIAAGKHRIEVDTTHRQARRAGGGGAQGRRQGSRADDGQAHRARRLHRQRDVRRRRRSRLAGVARIISIGGRSGSTARSRRWK